MKTGFVTIFGRPNAGKSTLMNALMGEKLAIVSPKVQNHPSPYPGNPLTDEYQIILSDTPGIIDPRVQAAGKNDDGREERHGRFRCGAAIGGCQ